MSFDTGCDLFIFSADDLHYPTKGAGTICVRCHEDDKK